MGLCKHVLYHRQTFVRKSLPGLQASSNMKQKSIETDTKTIKALMYFWWHKNKSEDLMQTVFRVKTKGVRVDFKKIATVCDAKTFREKWKNKSNYMKRNVFSKSLFTFNSPFEQKCPFLCCPSYILTNVKTSRPFQRKASANCQSCCCCWFAINLRESLPCICLEYCPLILAVLTVATELPTTQIVEWVLLFDELPHQAEDSAS